MARTSTSTVENDYERERLEKIAKNQALLRDLALNAASAGLAPAKKRKAPVTPTSSSGRPAKRQQPARERAAPIATRSSSRLKGIVADSEVAKQKAEEENELLQQAERAKRQRRAGDLHVKDILVNGQHWNASGNFVSPVGPAQPHVRTFSAEDEEWVNSDKGLKELREKLSGLQLWQDLEPNRIKITPERIYSLACHPTTEKCLVFAGDKLGNLGIFDSNQSQQSSVKKEEDGEDGNEDDDPLWTPDITTLKVHSRTISTILPSLTEANHVYMSSYDSSIRRLDLAKGVAVEMYAPEDITADEPISGVQLSDAEPNMLYFTTLNGGFGIHDVRTKSSDTQMMQLSEKKIGGFSLHPRYGHFMVTASLDRTMKLWDLRKMSGRGENRLPSLLGEHESRLSVSHASFNSAGQVATASYDDTVKIYDFHDCDKWGVGVTLDEEKMLPATVVPHNNQTGRWVTILRAQWHAQPQDHIQRFVIGNMNRFVDIYTSKGEQLAQLGGDGITAVPAVAQFHPSMDWVAAGTASGKLCLWM